MGDIFGLSDQLSKNILAGKHIYVTLKEPIRLTEDYWFGTLKGDRTVKHYSGVKRITARYLVDSVGLKTLAEYGISNPLAVLYEVVPYSFVLDWLIDISSYLSILDALVGVNDLRYQQSFGYDCYMRFENHQRIINPGWDQMSVGVSVGKQVVRSRSALMADLTPKLPTYEPHIGLTRMISAVALLRNLKG